MEATTTTPEIVPALTAPLAHGPFTSIGDVKRAHSGHFFDEDTMRFFGSRIVDDWPIGGRFFRTSEQDRAPYAAWNGERRTTLRFCTSWGDIDEVGEFGEFATPKGAETVVRKFDTVTLSRVVDEHARTFWHVHLIGADTPVVMRAGSAFYDLPGALRLYDDLTGNVKRRATHDAIGALEGARHVLRRVSDDAAPKVARQVAALDRRRDALIGQLTRSAGIAD
jgi:hypothetical protein